MNKNFALVGFATLMLGFLAAACGSGREVEVAGDISAAPSAQVTGAIRLDFVDIRDNDGKKEFVSVSTIKDGKLGAFSQKVDLEGDSVRVMALSDTNGDGECSTGEAWGRAEQKVETGDKVENIKIVMAIGACPAPDASSEEAKE